MQIFYITVNCGDGLSNTEFYKSKECIDFLLNKENYSNDKNYFDFLEGDSGSWGSFKIPDGTPITGITIGNLESIKEEIALWS